MLASLPSPHRSHDETLLEAARKAALKARFNSKSDAAYTQAGTITYHFVLQ